MGQAQPMQMTQPVTLRALPSADIVDGEFDEGVKTHWTESPPASPSDALRVITTNVPRYSGNNPAAKNAVKMHMPEGKDYATLTPAERVQLLKAVEAHANQRNAEEAEQNNDADSGLIDFETGEVTRE
jgi:hypothetical protein